MNSLDFVGHVVLTVSSPLHHENDADEKEEDEADHWAHCGSNNHTHIGGYWQRTHSDTLHQSKLFYITYELYCSWGWKAMAEKKRSRIPTFIIFWFYEHGGCLCYVQVTISRLMKQLSEPAELVAVHTYFPDMLLLRLLSFKVPVFSSRTALNMEDYGQTYMHSLFPCVFSGAWTYRFLKIV